MVLAMGDRPVFKCLKSLSGGVEYPQPPFLLYEAPRNADFPGSLTHRSSDTCHKTGLHHLPIITG